MSTAATVPASPGLASPLPLGPSETKRLRWPWWGKALLGCGVGCAVLGAGAGVLFFAGVWWVLTPGVQIATDQVVTPDAVAVLHFSGQENLEGLTQLASVFLAEANEEQWRQRRERLPDSLRWIESIARMQDSQAGQAIGMWLPREATVAVVPNENGMRRVVLAANLRTFVRPVRMIVLHSSHPPRRVEKRAGAEIVHPQGDAAVCFAGGTVLWANPASALDRVLERARANSPPDRPAFLPAARYDRWKSGWSLALLADGRDERNREIVAGLLGSGSDAEAEGRTAREREPSLSYVAAGARLATADRFEAEFDLAVPDAVSASRWQALIDSLLARGAKTARAQGLTLTGTSRQTADGLTADVRLDGITAFVRRWAAEHSRKPRAPLPTARPEAGDGEAASLTVVSAR